LNDSIKRLEEKIAYLERHVTEQDKAMLELSDEIAALRKELRAVTGQGAPRDTDERRSGDAPAAEDERPPHY
jgi:SlyX protein